MNDDKIQCTCDFTNNADGSTVGCPVHDFGFRSTAARIEELTGLRSTPHAYDSTAAAAAQAAARGVVHQASAAARPVRAQQAPQDKTIHLAARDLLVSSVLLISDQPTTEQWHTIKNALKELLATPDGATGS